jgi:hypothetical protein
MLSRMLKKSASGVLAALRGSTYGGGLALALPVSVPAFDGTGTATKQKGGSPHRLLRPCLGQGASWRAGVGWVRKLAFLSILHRVLLLCQMYGSVNLRVHTEFFCRLLDL